MIYRESISLIISLVLLGLSTFFIANNAYMLITHQATPMLRGVGLVLGVTLFAVSSFQLNWAGKRYRKDIARWRQYLNGE